MTADNTITLNHVGS